MGPMYRAAVSIHQFMIPDEILWRIAVASLCKSPLHEPSLPMPWMSLAGAVKQDT